MQNRDEIGCLTIGVKERIQSVYFHNCLKVVSIKKNELINIIK